MPVIAVLSDIHGNHPALLACLAHAAARDTTPWQLVDSTTGMLAYNFAPAWSRVTANCLRHGAVHPAHGPL